MPAETPHTRRALSNLGGRIHLTGQPVASQPLADAFTGLEHAPQDELTHAFHAYPARLHPHLPRRLLERFAAPGQVVLDPFLGAGTTAVEAMRAGCVALGTDINPVALRIAAVRTLLWPALRLNAFRAECLALSEANFRDARKKVSRALSRVAREQAEWYAPHVLQELQGLADRIDGLEDAGFREVAWLVFSSILVKVSRQTSDSSRDRVDRQVGRGTTSRLFGDRAQALTDQLTALSEVVPPGTPMARLRQADARALPGPDQSVDLIITSPPYPGVYDYASHQALRFAWLDEDPGFAEENEIGSRRQAPSRETWLKDERAVFSELARVLKPGGRAFLVVGDGLLEGQPWFADKELSETAEEVGLRVMAIASQERPHFHEESAKAFGAQLHCEHLISLKKGR